MTIKRITFLLALIIFSAVASRAESPSPGSGGTPPGWKTAAPREEIRPEFSFESSGGRRGAGAFIIQHDERDGLDGSWTKTFPVKGGHFYRFEAFRKIDGAASPRRSAMVRLLWSN